MDCMIIDQKRRTFVKNMVIGGGALSLPYINIPQKQRPVSESKNFLYEVYFQSENKDWAKNYLYRRDYRITDIIHSIPQSNKLMKYYGSHVKGCFKGNSLLLRAKVYNQDQDNICLFQIWKDRDSYENFYKEVRLDNQKMSELLKSVGIQFKRIMKESISVSFLSDNIEKMRNREVIWQYVNDLYRKEWMILGDPIKENRGQKNIIRRA